jgi:hypothetical protein
MKKITLLLFALITFSISFAQNEITERKKNYELHIANANMELKKKNTALALKSLRKAITFTNDDQEINKILSQIKSINVEASIKAKAEKKKNDALNKKNKNTQEIQELVVLKRNTNKLHNNLIRNEVFTKKKKKLYKAYMMLYENLDKINDVHEKYTYTKDIETLQLNINYLKASESEMLSKQVKKLKEIDDIWAVFKENMPKQFLKQK